MRDLARLSPAERTVLRLLAQGHTAKSIAAELGISVNAVNERLRVARRKTGLGSSRELARLVRSAEPLPSPPEIWDKDLGVATSPPAGTTPLRPLGQVPAAGGLKGVLAMMVMASGLGALAVLLALGGVGAARPTAGPPHVVATFPSAGARVEPGPLRLSVTFDRPMQTGSYSFVGDPHTLPDCGSTPEQSADGRTFTLSCRLEPHHGYTIGFNGGRFRNFTAEDDGAPAEPSILRFSTR